MRKLEFTNNQQEELFNNNIGFAFTLSKDWAKKCALDKTDLDSYALEALATAAIKYDVKRNDSFKCFARMIINQNIQREIKAYSADKRSIDNNAVIGLDNIQEESFNNIETSSRYNHAYKVFEEAINEVDERMGKATKLYIINGYTQKEIAEEMGVAIMTISQWISKTKKIIAAKFLEENIITDSFFKTK